MLGIGLAAVISITSRALATQSDGEKRLQAAWLADELLNMVLVEGPKDYGVLYDMAGAFYEPFEEFGYTVDIEDVTPDLLYRVTATVSWGERERDFIEVQALISQRQGDPEQLREPLEPVDREARWYEDEEY
jgi:hypothetical protein